MNSFVVSNTVKNLDDCSIRDFVRISPTIGRDNESNNGDKIFWENVGLSVYNITFIFILASLVTQNSIYVVCTTAGESSSSVMDSGGD